MLKIYILHKVIFKGCKSNYNSKNKIVQTLQGREVISQKTDGKISLLVKIKKKARKKREEESKKGEEECQILLPYHQNKLLKVQIMTAENS